MADVPPIRTLAEYAVWYGDRTSFGFAVAHQGRLVLDMLAERRPEADIVRTEAYRACLRTWDRHPAGRPRSA